MHYRPQWLIMRHFSQLTTILGSALGVLRPNPARIKCCKLLRFAPSALALHPTTFHEATCFNASSHTKLRVNNDMENPRTWMLKSWKEPELRPNVSWELAPESCFSRKAFVRLWLLCDIKWKVALFILAISWLKLEDIISHHNSQPMTSPPWRKKKQTCKMHYDSISRAPMLIVIMVKNGLVIQWNGCFCCPLFSQS